MNLPIRPHSSHSTNSMWKVPEFMPPNENFFLKVTGFDREGYRFQRLSSVSFTSLVPGPPVVTMPNETHGYYLQPASIQCSSRSLIPFTLRLVRNGTRIGPDRLFLETVDTTWQIPSVSAADEGFYDCVAISNSGTGITRTFLVVTEPPPTVETPQNVTAFPGDQVVLTCQVLGSVRFNITWMQDGTEIQDDNEHVTPLSNSSLAIWNVQSENAGRYECVAVNTQGSSRASVWVFVHGDLEMTLVPFAEVDPVDGTLEIKEVQETDAGEYTCVASNEAGTSSAMVMLDVGSAPRFSETPSDVSVTIGQNVTLPCSAVGDPAPQVTWQRIDGRHIFAKADSMSFMSQLKTGSLFIESVWLDDEARYVCEAQNQFGVIRAEVTLTIIGLVAPEVVESISVVNVLEGRSLTLPCVVLAGNPFPERYWLKDNQLLSLDRRLSIRSDGSFHIERAEQGDAGRYMCTIRNVVGSVNKTITVYVQVLPSIKSGHIVYITDEGMSVTLLCESSGSPKPTLIWSKGGKLLPRHDPRRSIDANGNLQIPSPSSGDSGVYTCTATNVAGFASREMQLFVHTKPKIYGVNPDNLDEPIKITATAGMEVTLPFPPKIHLSHQLLRVIAGQSVDLPCVAHGDPTPKIRWYKGDEALLQGVRDSLDGPDGSISIADVEISDAGMYRCEATNSAGRDVTEMILAVLEPPFFDEDVASLDAEQERFAREKVTLPCPANGTPPPSIRWLQNGIDLPANEPGISILEDGSLLIESASPYDSGDYLCIATNEAGSSKKMYRLKVRAPPEILGNDQISNITALVNQPLILECDASGNPTPTLSWYKNERQVAETSRVRFLNGGRLLRVPKARKGDSGVYSCNAVNEAGWASKQFNLLVQVPPVIFGSELTQEVTVLENSQLELRCGASGVPFPHIAWSKDGE
ncbi:hypothetical protein scyTo_0010207 [Scyliorhinus torazame]|uniref:Ig-like domain-containing protein n=1 Tax=Scyliorhinus torazame TaxID=75743 RepID=A0A401P1V6_SCYTO|nr:hypothetical protein [Scyliorhinus torazame]